MIKYWLMLSLILLAGCQSIAEIKSEEYVGEEVTVRGVVEDSIKIGDLSGYTLASEGESIRV